MHSRILFLFVLILALFTVSSGQNDEIVTDPHGKKIRIRIDNKTGAIKGIRGFSEYVNNFGKSNSARDISSVEEIGSTLISEYAPLLGFDKKNLQKKRIFTTAGAWNIKYQQTVDGVPVENAIAFFQIGSRGDITVQGLLLHRDLRISTVPSFTGSQVLEKLGIDPTDTKHSPIEYGPELIIYPEEIDSSMHFLLAWKIIVAGQPDTRRYYIDAITGEIISSESNEIKE